MTSRGWFRLALFCAVFPLVAGPAAFLAWAWSRTDGVALGAYLTIKLGVYLFLLGLYALPKFVLKSRAEGAVALPRRAIAVGALLLLVLPASGGLAWGIYTLSTRCAVTIVNGSERPLEQLALSGHGAVEEMGTLPAGARTTRRFSVRADGALRLGARWGERRIDVELEGYVTPNLGDAWTVTLDRDGAPRVEKGYR